MPQDINITTADYQKLVRICIRNTVNFQDDIQMSDELEWLGIDTANELDSLKDWLTGRRDPEVGVTRYLYRLNRNYLNDMGGGWAVGKLVERVELRSIPDMTHSRAEIVVRDCIKLVIQHTIPEIVPNRPLKEFGLNTPQLVGDFLQNVVQHPYYGVQGFKRVIDPSRFNTVAPSTPVGQVIDALKVHSKPAF